MFEPIGTARLLIRGPVAEDVDALCGRLAALAA